MGERGEPERRWIGGGVSRPEKYGSRATMLTRGGGDGSGGEGGVYQRGKDDVAGPLCCSQATVM